MVDSINPTPQNENLYNQAPAQPVSNPAPQPAQAVEQTDPFFSGFAKPSEVQVNLASTAPETGQLNTSPAAVPTAPVQEPVENIQTPPATAAKFSDFKPQQTVDTSHQTYSDMPEALNWRGIAFISGMGVLATVVFALAAYFSAGAIYGNKVATAEAELASAESKLAKERTAPEALELPVEVTTPVSESETPTAPVVEQPIQTPETVPVTTPDGGTEANG